MQGRMFVSVTIIDWSVVQEENKDVLVRCLI